MMTIHEVRFFSVQIPFVRAFKHSSAERATTETVLVQIVDEAGRIGYGEGCPRSYVTGESISSATTFFRHQASRIKQLDNLKKLIDFVTHQVKEIDANPAAWSAVEMALLDVMGKSKGMNLEALLGIPSRQTNYSYTAVLGDSSPAEFHKLYLTYRQLGYTDFKIKLANEPGKDLEKLVCMRADEAHIRVRADANNLWASPQAALRHLSELNFPFQAIEEPLQSKRLMELQEIADATGAKIILDESLLRIDQVQALAHRPERWMVNARNSKYGGVLRSLRLINELVKCDIDIVVGAHVGESSLLTRASLVLADAARHKLRAQEGGFSTHLLTTDLFEPNLKIGKRGQFSDVSCRENPGLGMEPTKKINEMPEIIPLL